MGFGIRIPKSGKYLFRIPDPGVKKAPNPGSRILIFTHPGSRISDPGSRIPDPKTTAKERGEKNFWCSTFFCSHKCHIIENYFIFEMLKKNFLANFQRIIELFTQKIVTKLSNKGLGSGILKKTYSGSRIQGSKKHRIPDPDQQHCLKHCLLS